MAEQNIKHTHVPFRWTGCKRQQADFIIDKMPDNIPVYIEPFLGSGAVMMRLLEEDRVNPGTVFGFDINPDVVYLWTIIKNTPELLNSAYEWAYKEFNAAGADIIKKHAERTDSHMKAVYDCRVSTYTKYRDMYNTMDKNSPERGALLYILLKFCFNGIPRYNKKGLWNTPCQPTRPGPDPDKTGERILYWSKLLNDYNVDINLADYADLSNIFEPFILNSSVIYCDPPYRSFAGTGAYGVNFDFYEFGKWCHNMKCDKLLISFNTGDSSDLFPDDEYIKYDIESGLRYFKLTGAAKKHEKNVESLYIKNEKKLTRVARKK